jgi:deltex-like protein
MQMMNKGIKVNQINIKNNQMNQPNNNFNINQNQMISQNSNPMQNNQMNQPNNNFNINKNQMISQNSNPMQNNQLNQANNNANINQNQNINQNSNPMQNNQFNQINNNFNINQNQFIIQNFNQMPNNQMNEPKNNFNINQNQFNVQNFNQNIDPSQSDLYLKLQNKNFSSPPKFNNNLTIETAKISIENKNIYNEIIKSAKISFITPLEILYKEQYDLSQKTSKERDKCAICLCEFYDDIIPDNKNLALQDINIYIGHDIDVVKLCRCEDHFYHIECLHNLIKDKKGGGFKCPICQKIYGILVGTMPSGSMTAKITNSKCAGFPHDKTIVISYYIPDGQQNGKYFSGTSRIAYLPNNKEGREVLALLKIAFDRKLTFVVGTSVTTGQKNTVIWNGIHHKTSLHGGTQNYGYPDPTYFNRVKEELASKGVLADDFGPEKLEQIAKNLLKGY